MNEGSPTKEEKIKTLRETLPFLNQPVSDNKLEFTPEQEKEFNDTRRKIVEQLGYTVTVNDGKWIELEKKGYTIHLKHFMLPSVYGVGGGRISQIEIIKGENRVLWDQGWGDSGEPKDEEVKKIFDELVSYLN